MASSREVRAGRAAVEIGINDKFSKALRSAQLRLNAFGKSARRIGASVAGAGLTIAAPLALATKIFANAGDQLDKMSLRTGFSAEALSQLGFAAEQSGADIETLENGIRVMQRTINDAGRGLSTATDGLDSMGLSFEMLKDLSPEDQFEAIADGIAGIEDPSKRAAVAMQTLGRSGTKLLPLMLNGAAGIAELRKQADDLGLTISTSAAAQAAVLTDTLNILRRVILRTAVAVGEALAPHVVKVAEKLTEVVVAVKRWVDANRGVVVSVAKVAAGLVLIGGSLIGLGIGLSIVAFAFGGLASAVAFAGAVIAAIVSPIGLTITAVVALGGSIVAWSDAGGMAIEWLMSRFGELSKFVGKVAKGMSDALAAGDLQLAADVLWAGLRVAWETGAQQLNNIWLGVRNFFVTQAHEMWFGALAALQLAAYAMEIAWIETASFMSKTWANFAAGFKGIMERAIGFVSKRLLELGGLFDESLDVEGAKRDIDLQVQQKLTEIDEDRAAAVYEAEDRRRDSREKSARQNDATLKQLEADFNAAQQALAASTGESVEKAQANLDAARKRLDDAIAEAADARAGLSESETGRGRVRAFIEDFEGMLSGIADRSSVQGTFSGFDVRGLTVGTDAERRTAVATEKIAGDVSEIKRNTKSGGATFA
jgi:hypothetical protein